MVHQYQLNGYNIVLDSCSCSIHVVDEVAPTISSPSSKPTRRRRLWPPCWRSTAAARM